MHVYILLFEIEITFLSCNVKISGRVETVSSLKWCIFSITPRTLFLKGLFHSIYIFSLLPKCHESNPLSLLHAHSRYNQASNLFSMISPDKSLWALFIFLLQSIYSAYSCCVDSFWMINVLHVYSRPGPQIFSKRRERASEGIWISNRWYMEVIKPSSRSARAFVGWVQLRSEFRGQWPWNQTAALNCLSFRQRRHFCDTIKFHLLIILWSRATFKTVFCFKCSTLSQ